MVLPSARRFTDLGVQPRQRLATLKDVEETPRDYSAADSSVAAATENAAAGAGDIPSEGPAEAPPSAAPLETTAAVPERPH
jgi:hypothetical protein